MKPEILSILLTLFVIVVTLLVAYISYRLIYFSRSKWEIPECTEEEFHQFLKDIEKDT